MSNIETSFTSLEQQIDRLKVAVDRCHTPGIYVHTYKIASLVKDIQSLSLSESQKKVLNKLDEETLKQFERISKGRCSCSVSNDI